MAPPIPIGPFAMPMYREGVPRGLRPWIHLVMLVLFQLTGCIYLGVAQHVAGTTGLMHDDVMFIGICNVIGVNMPFPLLFRFKFRFTNRQLLLTAAQVIAACNVLALATTSLPLLCVLSFVAGFFKLCGTFECASNIQLWFAPNRDFKIFFPVLYIMVVGDIFLQSWLAGVVTYHCSWQHVNLLITLLMLAVALTVVCLTKNFRFRRPLPLISVDWLGMLLWSLLFGEVVWLFCYGEYYNWTDGATWRTTLAITAATLVVTLQRARHIRHPYISLQAFGYKTLWPLLGLYLVAEWLNTTPKVLQNTLTGGVLHWGWLTTGSLELVGWVGNLVGCLFTLWWMKGLRLKYTSLLIVGGMGLVAYQVMMYFYVSPTVSLQLLCLPLLLRAFGYAIYFTALTIYLEELMPFEHFFMGLTISGIMRNGPIEAVMSGVYSFGLRHQTADNLARGLYADPQQALLVGLKQLFGITCLLGVAFLLVLMLWNVQPVRSTMKKMPKMKTLARRLARIHGRG